MTNIKNSRAFTLIEVLIVIVVVAIAAVIVLPSLLGGSHQSDLSGTTQQIIASLRLAQTQAAQQVQAAQWGVYFSNTTNTAPFYAIFSGSSYSSGTVQSVYRLPADVGFVSSTVPVGSAINVTFLPVSGGTSISSTIQLYSISQPSLSSTISIDGAGSVMLGLSAPEGSTTVAGNVYGVSAGFEEVLKFSLNPSTGAPISTFGSYGSNACASGSFKLPEYMAVNNMGDFYVTDMTAHCVGIFNASGTFLSQFAANRAGGIAIASNGNVYIAENGNAVIDEYSASGTLLGSFNEHSSGGYSFNDIAIDASGNLYVTDYVGNSVEKYNSSGTFISQFGGYGSGTGQFSGPTGIAIDSSGNVYVADSGNNRIEKFNSSGTFISQFGSYGTNGNGTLDYPTGIAIDSAGNIYVADSNVGVIEKFNSSGTYLYNTGAIGGYSQPQPGTINGVVVY